MITNFQSPTSQIQLPLSNIQLLSPASHGITLFILVAGKDIPETRLNEGFTVISRIYCPISLWNGTQIVSLRTISIRTEPTLELLRYSFAGYHPSKTAHQARSPNPYSGSVGKSRLLFREVFHARLSAPSYAKQEK